TAIVLAAGAGSRMRSSTPKILHAVAGRPMLRRVLDAVAAAGIGRRIVVLGPATIAARSILNEHDGDHAEPDASDTGIAVAFQAEALGTADAVRAAAGLTTASQVMVLNGDLPLIQPQTLDALRRTHEESGAPLTLLAATVADPAGIGRVQRDQAGEVVAVVEERDATPELRTVREINAGAYCFRGDWLWPHLEQIAPSPVSGEYYLTDLVRMAAAEGLRIAVVSAEEDEVRGVNTRAELAAAEAIARRRVRLRLMDEGVTLIDPQSAYVDEPVRLGRDSVIHPNTHLLGDTVIGVACELGPNTVIRSSQIGDNCRIVASMLEEAIVEDEVTIGPFSHLRPGASIGRGVELGNYAEVKQSRLGAGTLMHHFGYIGDATIGGAVNVGAGTITCNFDGRAKHETHVGDGAFIGSDTMLVAPVSLGDGARTGAGSVVTRDVEAGILVAGVPAKPLHRTPASLSDKGEGLA
ncbi:MAG TPA: bifunctional UDP-N-acetylglucosamine diphosphorylase/glucosamine-1-phosphate N-acetyltransferase GlmU, partial [Steroidobacteraceae bacterium]|nr:bifunctional UDP-N-acetylglucosamine diphosphorylase/glucosamine-1-phosphate N-acetyltransferase GlmU [Steroidobacteraceae bacterium]